MAHEAGKGSKPRKGADLEAYAQGWERVFGSHSKNASHHAKHTCPYREDVLGDYKTLCDCDHDATHQCKMDI
jgi:hypothetical protein